MPPLSLSFSTLSATAGADLLAAKSDLARRFLTRTATRPKGAVLYSAAPSPEPDLNVVGVGIGEMISEGRLTGIPAVKLFVRYKVPPSQLEAKNALPKTINGIPTDVEEIGLVRPLLARKRVATRKKPKAKRQAARAAIPAAGMPDPRVYRRPAQPGCSIGFRFPVKPGEPEPVMAGTFGALVRSSGSPVYILSNNHVLANEDQLPVGAPIYQPGLLDDNRPKTNQIAKLTQAVPLNATGTNEVDAAIAEVLNAEDVLPDVLFIGRPTGVATAELDMTVHKFGRTTSYTVGRVSSLNTDVKITYDVGELLFTDQIIIRSADQRPFSQAGDSGSLILERRTNNAVGLLFAGSNSHTIANHIQTVLSQLGVTLV
jgi:hypothetical protein